MQAGLANPAGTKDAAVPTAERMVCSEDQQPFWADVGRHMTRNAAGILCPIVSMGDDWGALPVPPRRLWFGCAAVA